MKTFQQFTIGWRDIVPYARSYIPPLTFSDHKGSMGRVGVIGGSSDYTGAPYYAGSAALKFGADLATVFCSRDASIPIKSYSPELMVTGVYDDRKVEYVDLSNQVNLAEAENEILKMVQKVKDFLPRLHSLVIGPGLGRNHFVMKGVAEIVEAAKARDMNMIFDADSLWMLASNLPLIRGYTRCILTPNKVEFDRLVQALVNELDGASSVREEDETVECNNPSTDPLSESLRAELVSKDPAISVRAVSLALGGVPILAKGEKDLFTAGGDVFELNQPQGSPRRCGGQGDILAGALAVSVFWGNQLPGNEFTDFAARLPSSTSVKGQTHNTAVDLDYIAEKYNRRSHGHHIVENNTRAILTKGLGRAMPDKTILSTEMKASPSAAYRRRQTTLLAAILASATIRRASELTFNQFGRSMTTPDILVNIGPAFEELTTIDEGKL